MDGHVTMDVPRVTGVCKNLHTLPNRDSRKPPACTLHMPGMTVSSAPCRLSRSPVWTVWTADVDRGNPWKH